MDTLHMIFQSGIDFSIKTFCKEQHYQCRVGKDISTIGSYAGCVCWIIEIVLEKYKNCLFSIFYIEVYNYYAKQLVDLNNFTIQYKLNMMLEYCKKYPYAWAELKNSKTETLCKANVDMRYGCDNDLALPQVINNGKRTYTLHDGMGTFKDYEITLEPEKEVSACKHNQLNQKI